MSDKARAGGDVFIVDNSDSEWKVRRYLHDWADIASRIDIATGYFEIGALLALDGQWQKLDALRILMGDEISKRTKAAMLAGVNAALERLNASIEEQKKTDDFLTGADAVVDGLRAGKIRCRVYTKEKFHAKAYINHARQAVIGSAALVGSSNFTAPGLTQNVELNVQIRGREVELLQEWYEKHWDKAEEITDEVLRVVERHTKEYTPFEVYAKALHEYFHADRLEPDDWERHKSKMYHVLDAYQQDGYHNLVKIAERYNGAFLCDAVGLGKTFIGLMVIERMILQERKNVLLLVPKAGVDTVWRPALKKYLKDIRRGAFGGFDVLTHSDLTSGNEDIRDRIEAAKERAHVVIIDEAHHFRNTGTRGDFLGDVLGGAVRRGRPIPGEGRVSVSRYWKLFDLIQDKKCFLLTATPINNSLSDLRRMIELFSRRRDEYFAAAPLGITNLQAHFRELDRRLDQIAKERHDGPSEITDVAEAQEVLETDPLINALVVQRSRAYVKESQLLSGAAATQFPKRDDPQVIPYGLKATYGDLLQSVDRAFHRDKPLFSLAPYVPLDYATFDATGPEYAFEVGRQKQIVALIRTGFLKRFESSVHAFDRSCERLVVKLLAFVFAHQDTAEERRRLEKWMARHEKLVQQLKEHHPGLFNAADKADSLFAGAEEDDGDPDLAQAVLDTVDDLPRITYRVHDMLMETMDDLDILADFLSELDRFKPEHDDKCRQLVKLLKTDKVLKANKLLLFTEFADTAEYLLGQLAAAGIEGVYAVDGSSGTRDRADVIRRFAPYYNGSNSRKAAEDGGEIRILISTDVLSEGLNLQDCTRLINYDLHWNPVRLMQRIGRVDRRMSPDVEVAIKADHPEQAPLRGHVIYWNFLPPAELNALLSLYRRVTHKTLRISKTFGIEGGKLLTGEDDYDVLRAFNAAYERTTPTEDLRLEYDKLLATHPTLAERLTSLPGRVFSGKAHPKPGSKAVFFCFALPVPATKPRDDREGTLFALPSAVNGSGDSGSHRKSSGTGKTQQARPQPHRLRHRPLQIDKVIEEHGRWPGAFVQDSGGHQTRSVPTRTVLLKLGSARMSLW
jgi:superfamily II DNA or RNA helicase